MDENTARTDLVEVARLAYSRSYICGSEGNFSIRLNKECVLTTPSGSCKGRLCEEDLVVTDLNGSSLTEGKRPSTELNMHLSVYRQRTDVQAIVHAHPTFAVALTVAGMSLSKDILPEVVCTLGSIYTAPYATPSTDEVAQSIEKIIAESDAVMLDHHGALTVGADIWDAFYKLETLEHHAKTLAIAEMLASAKELPEAALSKLMSVHSVYGLTKAVKVAGLSS
jgi:L-fuculose-phosphate aldolase